MSKPGVNKRSEYGVWSVWNDKLWAGPLTQADAVSVAEGANANYPGQAPAFFVVARRVTDWEADRG